MVTDHDLTRTLAFDAGYLHALHLAAERVDELDALWHPISRPTHEEQVAERIAEMEACATQQRANTWRGRYPGGPVDFETGRPIGASQ